MSLIHIKHCLLLIADDNTLRVAPQITLSGAGWTRVCNIVDYGSVKGEYFNACGGRKCIAWHKPGSAVPCMA